MSLTISKSSLTSVPLEPHLPNADHYSVDNGSFKTTSTSFTDPHTIIRQPDINSCSIGLEPMQKADDLKTELKQFSSTTHLSDRRSNGRLPPLLENQEVESGALISAAPENESVPIFPAILRIGKARKWWHSIPFFDKGSHITNPELERLFLPTISGTNSNNAASQQLHITRLLSNNVFQQQYANLKLERVSVSVQTKIESDDSFEVSLLLGENTQCTVDIVMDVISNIDLLNLWCNPIEILIVTSNSSEGSSFATNFDGTRMNIGSEGLTGSNNCLDDSKILRECEAKWIEATTSSLESPYSRVNFILSAGQSVLRSLGFTSYGKITMFIERRQARIGLTVGPFHGGIYASHSISVSSEAPSINKRRIRIVDRVHLTRDSEEDASFLGTMFECAMGSCLSHFFFPSIVGYVDQVTMSMTRLRILLDNG